jgi:threonine 3-dehydrogenase
MGKSLVTGGFGFVGSYLVRRLLEDEGEVVLFQRRRTPPADMEKWKSKMRIVSGDISNWVHVIDALRNHDIDCIYHTAGLLVKECEESPAAAYRINVNGTFNLLEAARILNIQNFIFTSTAFIYGSPPPKKVCDESMPRPTQVYPTTKVCCERLGECYHRRYGINFRGIRFPLVMGPGRKSHYYRDFFGVIEVPASGQNYSIHSDPSRRLSIIYVKDAAKAMIDLKRAKQSRLRQQVYNVQGFAATLREVVDTVSKLVPDAHIDFASLSDEEKRFAGETPFYEIDNCSAQEDFSWQPSYPLDRMVEDIIKEIRRANLSISNSSP